MGGPPDPHVLGAKQASSPDVTGARPPPHHYVSPHGGFIVDLQLLEDVPFVATRSQKPGMRIRNDVLNGHGLLVIEQPYTIGSWAPFYHVAKQSFYDLSSIMNHHPQLLPTFTQDPWYAT